MRKYALKNMIKLTFVSSPYRSRVAIVDYPEPAYSDLLARHQEAMEEMEANANRPLVDVSGDNE